MDVPHITVDPEEVVAEAIQRDMNRMSQQQDRGDLPKRSKEPRPQRPPSPDSPRDRKRDVDSDDEWKDPVDVKSPELEKYWKAVRSNPSDFTGWTYLLQYVEQEV